MSLDLRGYALCEQYAMDLGLPAHSEPWTVLEAVLALTGQDIHVSTLQQLARDMGGQLQLQIA